MTDLKSKKQSSTSDEAVTSRSRLTRRRAVLQVFGILLLVPVSVGGSAFLASLRDDATGLREEEPYPIVRVLEPEQGEHRVRVFGTGTVRPRNYVELVPQVSGRVVSVYEELRRGGRFDAGKELFRIDSTDFDLDVERFRAQLASARTDVETRVAEGRVAREEWRDVYEEKPITSLAAKEPQIERARSSVTSAESDLKRAELNVSRTRFTLPFSGTVVESVVEVGQYVMSGQNVGRVYSNDSLEVSVALSDADLKWLLPLEGVGGARGSSNVIEVVVRSTFAGRTSVWEGDVAGLESELDERSRMARVVVRIRERKSGDMGTGAVLLPGMFVEIEFLCGVIRAVERLPESALQSLGRIWRVVDDRLSVIEPELLLFDEGMIVVRAAEEEAPVVIDSVNGLSEGMMVRVTVVNREGVAAGGEAIE